MFYTINDGGSSLQKEYREINCLPFTDGAMENKVVQETVGRLGFVVGQVPPPPVVDGDT